MAAPHMRRGTGAARHWTERALAQLCSAPEPDMRGSLKKMDSTMTVGGTVPWIGLRDLARFQYRRVLQMAREARKENEGASVG